jgi:hypothetical protein
MIAPELAPPLKVLSLEPLARGVKLLEMDGCAELKTR